MADVKVIVDTATGEHKYIPLSAEEIAEREAQAIQAEADRLARELEEEAIADAKASGQSKLIALGLTESEIKAMLGI
jgi:regulator of protease activity HflC (stomatin/prohibitin superfamily)